MKIDDEKMVSMSEANNNFSKVARMADEKGSAIKLGSATPNVPPWRDTNFGTIAARLFFACAS